MIKLIVAVDKNYLIGNNLSLPWNIKEELSFFKSVTENHDLLFGKKTFLALPQQLINRQIFVISEEEITNADKWIKNEQQLLLLFNQYQNSDKILFIAGGKTIYEKYFNYADELIISKIKKSYFGNVHLNIDLQNYQLIDSQDLGQFVVEKYQKKHF